MDGGKFSMFVSEKKPCLWLTGLIVKIFCQSGEYLQNELDLDVIKESIVWITSMQHNDGSWTEPSTFIHTSSFMKRNILTASLLITLHQCKNYLPTIYNETDIYNDCRKNAENYIKAQLSKETDSYALAIMTYSLLISELNVGNNSQTIMINNLINHSDKRMDPEMDYLYYDHGLMSVATSSYVLLCLNRYFNESHYKLPGKMLYNWLLSRWLNETFDNIQNILLIFEAMADYPNSIEWNNNEMRINISFDNGNKHRIEWNNQTKPDLFHWINIGKNVSSINIELTGNGLGRMELLTSQNVYFQHSHSQCNFELEIDIFDAHFLHYLSNDEFDETIFFDETFQQEMFIQELPSKLLSKNSNFICSISDSKKMNTPLKIPPNDSAIIDDNICSTQLSDAMPNLPENVENPVFKVIKLCSKRSSMKWTVNEYGAASMVVLEASIISGYKVVDEDLKTLKSLSIIDWYELTASKVVFFLSSIPSGANSLCFCFRIYQQFIVENVQSAIIRIYDSHKTGLEFIFLFVILMIVNFLDWNCLSLYSDLGAKHYINYTCANNACQCMINQKCPRQLILPDSFDLDWFKNIVLSHQLVVMANISMDNQPTSIMGNLVENPIFFIESYQLIWGGLIYSNWN